MSQIDDVEAIAKYMKEQHAINPKAKGILDLFASWYQGSGWYDKNFSSDWYDQARSRRHQFDLANAATPAALAQVQKVMAEGMTTEQMQGKPRPKIDVKTGAVGSQVSNPTVPGIAPGLSRNLKKGVNGDDVKQWQSLLGLNPPTGYFDALTDAKTRDWQKLHGLKVDGIVGKNTWSQAFGVHATVTPALPTPAKQTPAAAANVPTSSTPPVSPHVDVTEASVIPSLDTLTKLPWWAKALAALGVGGGLYVGIKHHESQKRT